MCKNLIKMLRISMLFSILLAVLGQTEGFFENFQLFENLPKCCRNNEYLSVNTSNENFECIEDREKELQVLSSSVLSKFSDEDNFCIDSLVQNKNASVKSVVKLNIKNLSTENLSHYNSVPKCCPLNYLYDLRNHNCVKFNETFHNDHFVSEPKNKALFIFKAGIENCQHVIKDYEVNELSESNFDNDHGFFFNSLDSILPYGSYCLDKTVKSYVVRVCHNDYSVCKNQTSQTTGTRCIRKCCDDGKMFLGSPKCAYNFEKGLSFVNDSKVINNEESFAVVHRLECKKYMVNLEWEYFIDEMGNANVDLDGKNDVESPFGDNYCFENVRKGEIQSRRLFLCFKYIDKNDIEYQICRVALIFSCIFLALTLIGYLFLPEMQNLHGKTLMCHCISLLIAFLLLVVLQFYHEIEGIPCKLIAYFIMYTFLTAFMWSNIMCFDIWWTFGSMREQGIHQKKKEMKRFLYYCVYTLTIPAVISVSAFITQYYGEVYPSSISNSMKPFVPSLGQFNCFFEQRNNVTSFLVWFVLPIALIVICNFILYIKTMIYFYQVKKEINKLTDVMAGAGDKKKILLADMQRLMMALKLFLVMGISWLFESISVCFIPVPATGALQVIQILFDTINSLQGVYIFCIFVLKANFIKALRKKWGLKYEYLRRSSHSLASAVSASTYVTSFNKVRE